MDMKQLRISAGITQEQLANAVQVTVWTVAKWDQGTSFPCLPPNKICKLVEALNTDLETLAELDRQWRSGR